MVRVKLLKDLQQFAEQIELVELVGEFISEYLNGDVLTEDENKKILDDNGVKVKGQVDEKSVVYVKKAKENYLNEIIDITKNKKIDLEKLDKIVFVGRTSFILKMKLMKDIQILQKYLVMHM